MDITVYQSNSKGNLYQISDGQTPLLIEAGLPIKRIKEKLNFKLSEIGGCLISHEHRDHSHAVEDLMAMGIDCYMSMSCAEALGVYGHRVYILKHGRQQKIGTWTVKPFKLVHDVPNMGFLLASGCDKLFFAIDTNYIPYRFKGLTHIMLGVSYDSDILMDNVTCGHIDPGLAKRIFRHHMSFRTAKAFFQANDLSKVKAIYLLHLSDANSNAEKWKREIEGMTGRPVYIAGE